MNDHFLRGSFYLISVLSGYRLLEIGMSMKEISGVFGGAMLIVGGFVLFGEVVYDFRGGRVG